MFDPLSTTFIGIDLRGGKRSYTYAALDDGLKMTAFGQGRLDEIFSFISGCRSAVCAINAPLTAGPDGKVRTDFQQNSLFPIGVQRGRKQARRLAEHELLLKGIEVQPAPAAAEIPKSPVWVRRGYQFVQLLEQTGFKPWLVDGSTRQYLEVQAEAAFWHWLDGQPVKEDTLEGRIQRQLVLSEMDVDVPDPMNFFEEVTRFKLLKGQVGMTGIYSPQELNALMCALTAHLIVKKPAQVLCFGNQEEGRIYLPSHRNNIR